MKILGLDVSKAKVTACVLETVPDDLKRFNQKHKCLSYQADKEGISDLLSLDFDAVALEPTGLHYSWIWVHHLKQTGKPIRWVGHREIRHYRESSKLPNKSDNADAIAIAAYALERWHRPSAFVDGEGETLRYLYLQLESLNRLRIPIINRLRLQLSHECPEIQDKPINRTWLDNSPGILSAIAGTKVSQKWQKEMSRSIGTGISAFSQGLARQLILLDEQERHIERSLTNEMEQPQYQPYLETFSRYVIHGRIAAALLSQIYPIERFLNEDGHPIVERIDGRKYYRSLSSFKLTVGMGKVQYQSGGEIRWKAGGSAECRRALWQWVKTTIVMRPNLEIEAIAKLRDYYLNGIDQTIWEKGEPKLTHFDPGKGNQRVMRVARRAIEMLFYELIEQ